MKILAEQLARFRRAADSKLICRLAGLVRKHHPETVLHLSDAAVEERVEAALRAAQGYGITRTASLGAFVAMSFQVSPAFHQHPRIRAILTDDLVPADERVLLLARVLPGPLWAEAAKLGEGAALGAAPRGEQAP